jgi:hypothetical protein
VTIDEYLAELGRLLPRRRRRRVLAETEEHLHDAARACRREGLDHRAAERLAVERFGTPESVAREVAAAYAIVEVRLASLLAVGAALALFLPLYGIPENTLPPATWDQKPSDIGLLQTVLVVTWLTASLFAGLGLALSLLGHARVARTALLGAVVAVATFLVVGSLLFARWLEEAPSTPLWPFLALSLPVTAGSLAVCAAATVWVSRHARALERARPPRLPGASR